METFQIVTNDRQWRRIIGVPVSNVEYDEVVDEQTKINLIQFDVAESDADDVADRLQRYDIRFEKAF